MTLSKPVQIKFHDYLIAAPLKRISCSGSTSNSSYKEYVFFAGRRVAESVPSTSTVNYYFADHLGSARAMTDATGDLVPPLVET
jgi:hypothetical protein